MSQENLNVKTSPYENYFNAAIKYSELEETSAEAVKAFTQARKADARQALKDSEKLKTSNPEAYKNYQRSVLNSNLGKDEKKEEKKDKTLLYVGIGAVIAAIGAGIYFATKGGGGAEPTPQPKKITVHRKVYDSLNGFIKDLEDITVDQGSTVETTNASMNLTGYDTTYVATFDGNFTKKYAFDSDGSATFTAPSQEQENVIFIRFPELGTNPLGQQVSYSWLGSNAGFPKDTRVSIGYRADRNNKTGPENIWTGEYISQIKAPGALIQIKNALNTSYHKWGDVIIQQSSTGATFSYGYGYCDGAHGAHADFGVLVDPDVANDVYSRAATALSEYWEYTTNTDNIGGNSSGTTIQHWGVLNDNGKKLLLCAAMMSSASLTSSSSSPSSTLSGFLYG